jgi:hypothetical protein
VRRHAYSAVFPAAFAFLHLSLATAASRARSKTVNVSPLAHSQREILVPPALPDALGKDKNQKQVKVFKVPGKYYAFKILCASGVFSIVNGF